VKIYQILTNTPSDSVMSLRYLYIIIFRHSRGNGNPVALVLDSRWSLSRTWCGAGTTWGKDIWFFRKKVVGCHSGSCLPSLFLVHKCLYSERFPARPPYARRTCGNDISGGCWAIITSHRKSRSQLKHERGRYLWDGTLVGNDQEARKLFKISYPQIRECWQALLVYSNLF